MRIYKLSLLLALSIFLMFQCGINLIAQDNSEGKKFRIAFYARGSTVGKLKKYEKEYNIEVGFITSETFENAKSDLSSYDLIVLSGFRGMNRGTSEEQKTFVANCKQIFENASQNKNLKILASAKSAGTFFKMNMPELIANKIIVLDNEVRNYTNMYNYSEENYRRLVEYILIKYLGRSGEIKPALIIEKRSLYHPDHEGFFGDAEEFLKWYKSKGHKIENVPRVAIGASFVHVADFIKRVVDALIREFEKNGIVAVAVNSMDETFEKSIIDLNPNLVVQTFYGRGISAETYKKLNIPHINAMLIRRGTISDWEKNLYQGNSGFGSIDRAELSGLIEPIAVGGKKTGISPEPYTPIPERVTHLVSRSIAWIKLAQTKNADKKIVMTYPGTFVSAKSVMNVLQRMKEEGYKIENIPGDSKKLIELIEDHGHQIDYDQPEEVDKLARSGYAELIPLETYNKWFNTKLPKVLRKEVVKLWGEAPGNLMNWTNDEGKQFIVLPKLEFGNVILMPKMIPAGSQQRKQEVRLQLMNRLKDNPYTHASHNLIAACFWRQEVLKPDAIVVWGELSFDLLLPWKASLMRNIDWPDVLVGEIPNIRPFSVSSLSFSIPAHRKTYAVLIDYLTPPLVTADLSDEMLNIYNDVLKWESLEEGALKENFRKSITKQVVEENIDKDLGIVLNNREMTNEEISTLAGYLNDIHQTKIEMNPHVLGEEPPRNLMVPYLTTCLGRFFLNEIEKIVIVPENISNLKGEKTKFLRSKAEEIVDLIFNKEFSPFDAVKSVCGDKIEALSKDMQSVFDTLARLIDGFSKTHNEIDNMMLALNGGYVPPGHANPPERNTNVVPTGRNMYTANPEELPSKQSWELGKQLIDEMLKEQVEQNGKYPNKIAFSLNARRSMVDYGMNEAQILYLLGVKPVWDAQNRVNDVEIIPAEELKRSRIDVMIETYHYYNDYLECRARLVDKAIRLVAELDEANNKVFKNTQEIHKKLAEEGIESEKAKILASARMFSLAPGKFGSGAHDELFGETGNWDDRKELVELHLIVRDYVYTDKMWGVRANKAYRKQIEGTDIVMRNLSHHGALGGRSFYSGGNLCLAIKELTGKEPEYLLCDTRFPGMEKIITAEEALRKDFRAILFNRKWIEGMMKSGRGGAANMANMVWHTLGWKINRENSVTDDVWEEITDIYIRDSKELNIREWFNKTNPDAFAELASRLIETVRKEYWDADKETVLEIIKAFINTCIDYDCGEHDNEKMEKFIETTLNAPGNLELAELYQKYAATFQQSETVISTDEPNDKTEKIEGKKLEVKIEQQTENKQENTFPWIEIIIGIIVVGLIIIGFRLRKGVPKLKENNTNS